IGAGAAGISLAPRLLKRGRRVVLLESGGLDYEAPAADLNAGENEGEAYYQLEDSRLRFFGGTTAILGGRCAELDPIDLEARDYVPHSGWPLGWESCVDLEADPRCQIVTHATVTAIVPGGGGVERVEARSLGAGRLTVRAAAFVLAAGGIENPRLLLASRLGNDQVGRYFMEHPHARGGRIVESAAWPLLKAFGRRHRIAGHDLAALIAPSEALQRRERILNTSLTIVARQPQGRRQLIGMKAYSGLKHKMAPTKRGRALWMATKKAAGWAQRHIDPARPWLLHKLGGVELALLVRGEQAPNPESRVTLAGEKDPTGVPRVKLDWRLSEIDVRSVAVLVEALGRELGRLGLGRVEPADWLAPAGGRPTRSSPRIRSAAITISARPGWAATRGRASPTRTGGCTASPICGWRARRSSRPGAGPIRRSPSSPWP
ncbi:MAG: hypothetical protein QOJ27_753, partial [Sphingomonadales bacterium]|nr:hypothetical protein [Sphingomonadales bacterium]